MDPHNTDRSTGDRLAGLRVLVVEDEPAVARLLSRMLTLEGCEVQTVDRVADAGAQLATTPDVVVLDVDLPDGSGLDLVPTLHSGAQPTGVVVVTGSFDKRTIDHTIRAGITEYLRKPFRQDDLVESVEMAARATRRWRSRLAEAPDGPSSADSAPHRIAIGAHAQPGADLVERLSTQASLTARERQVLELMLAGKRNTEIAEALEISVHTVKYHSRNTLAKLGSESRLHLFRKLARDGLL